MSLVTVTPKDSTARFSSTGKTTTIRYIHERKPKLRWWRRMLGRWGR